ncbi:hypothetical protein BU17DRAFT_85925 [Hysterangium stoloniferum]|nr:hypothetical protein BU17DRAFT_85925 [Hysterangium stoloniferum]
MPLWICTPPNARPHLNELPPLRRLAWALTKEPPGSVATPTPRSPHTSPTIPPQQIVPERHGRCTYLSIGLLFLFLLLATSDSPPPDTQPSSSSQSANQSSTKKLLRTPSRRTSLEDEQRQDGDVLKNTVIALLRGAVQSGVQEFDVGSAVMLLSQIAETANPPLLPALNNLRDARKCVVENDELFNLLGECLQKGSFSEIRSLEMLQPVRPHLSSAGLAKGERILDTDPSIEATIKSWSHPFQGNIDDILYEYITKHNNPNMYTRLLPIVQSSGMGKSRLIDEFSKKHFVVPFNLRAGHQGYPAPDTAVLQWLTRCGLKSHESDDRFIAFLTALFEKILKVIDDPQFIQQQISDSPDIERTEKEVALQNYPKSLPEQFRDFMTVGQTFDKQGPLRINFYADSKQLYRGTYPQTMPSKKSPQGRFNTEVLDTVLRQVLPKINPSFLPNKEHAPILCLAFDEGHTLSQAIYETDPSTQWTAFTSLRRALRNIRPFPIWSFFLSTTGRSDQFAPPAYRDTSNRILRGELVDVKPFSALGFDHMARKFDKSLTLKDVTELGFRLSLGRPLWSTRYRVGGDSVRKTVIRFAIEKLLCRSWQPGMKLGIDEQFAVMSRRLALDFNTTTLSGADRREADANEMVQVEKYMRVCLGVKAGFESVVTVAASEPMLTEAAATVMQYSNFKSCQALRQILEWPGMSKGDRGEVITCNITIDTLDRLMFQTKQLESESLIVPVTSYFEALFAQGIYNERIKDRVPSMLNTMSHNKSFAETFKDSRIYVTHFIKIYDSNVLSIEFLLRLAARGAGVLCADNQFGIDVALPMLYKDPNSGKEFVSVIMKQSKNDFRYSDKPIDFLFDKMSPFDLRIFDKSYNPPPVIRMVYALASSKSGVTTVVRGARTQPSRKKKKKCAFQKDPYTSFDIWCAQASAETFGAIQSEDSETYNELLKLSKDVPKMFEPEEISTKEVVQSMYPGATSDPGHWNSFVKLSMDGRIESSDKGLRESESSIGKTSMAADGGSKKRKLASK